MDLDDAGVTVGDSEEAVVEAVDLLPLAHRIEPYPVEGDVIERPRPIDGTGEGVRGDEREADQGRDHQVEQRAEPRW